MYDIKTIRENPDLVKKDLNKRGDLDKITWVDDVLKYDKEWRSLITEANRLREQRNKVTAEIAELMKRGKGVEKKIEEAKKIPEEISRLENSAREYRDKMDNILLRLPNLMHESVVIGKDENDNVEIRRWGDPRQFDFKPKDHIDLSLALDLVDLKKAAKVAGARFYYLKNELVQLNYALINYALDFLREKPGFPACRQIKERRRAQNISIGSNRSFSSRNRNRKRLRSPLNLRINHWKGYVFVNKTNSDFQLIDFDFLHMVYVSRMEEGDDTESGRIIYPIDTSFVSRNFSGCHISRRFRNLEKFRRNFKKRRISGRKNPTPSPIIGRSSPGISQDHEGKCRLGRMG